MKAGVSAIGERAEIARNARGDDDRRLRRHLAS